MTADRTPQADPLTIAREVEAHGGRWWTPADLLYRCERPECVAYTTAQAALDRMKETP